MKGLTCRSIGLFSGPMFFLLMMLFGQDQVVMNAPAWSTAAIGLWMAVWWMTEAVPVPVTALLPVVVFHPLGIASIQEATAPYANPIIYLYLGGFLLALAVERWNLHRRIALLILAVTGTEGRRLVGGLMLTAALLSMWMTNTSTTIMLLPIVLSLLTVIGENITDLKQSDRNNLQTAMLLGLAYAATIGGLATLIGTPPNALLAGFLRENYNIEISFIGWMAVGVPVTLILLPLSWLLLTRLIYRFDVPESPSAQRCLQDLRADMGAMTTAEKRVSLIFGTVILGWVLRRPLSNLFGISWLSDTGIAMFGALLLFIIPSGQQRQALLSWEQAKLLPWGVIILFGGGLSLAAAISSTGLAQWLGESLGGLNAFGIVILIMAVATMVVFLTEMTSNLATTATLLPVISALAIETGVSPLLLCAPVALAASCAFMLPVATPPNAVVFSSGMLSIPQMVKAGVALNLISIILLSAICIWWVPYVFA